MIGEDWRGWGKREMIQAFAAAMDHAITMNPKSREEFSYLMMPFMIGWLAQARLLDSVTLARWNQLSDKYGELSLGKEVK